MTTEETTRTSSRLAYCQRGHAMTDENVYVKPNGKRNCRECHRLRQAERRQRLRVPPRCETADGLTIDDMILLETAPAWVRLDRVASLRYVEEHRRGA